MTNEELQRRFIADSQASESLGPVRLELERSLALTLVAQLQLALRHPGNTGLSAQLIRRFVDALIEKIAVTSAMREVFRRGDDPAYDVRRG